MEDGQRAFSTFRVLNGDANVLERDQLFRNMAQLYSYVSDRCDDEQVAQYDEVLCQLAELVEVEARTHVAKLLAPLDRAPGNVVNKLANDTIEVAAPLLEFSNVLSDDDLIDIIGHQSEEHRVAIAGRTNVPERVGEAIVAHGHTSSVVRLVRNTNAEFDKATLENLVQRVIVQAIVLVHRPANLIQNEVCHRLCIGRARRQDRVKIVASVLGREWIEGFRPGIITRRDDAFLAMTLA
jgi:uncharacterized protein (DUF2336 family)